MAIYRTSQGQSVPHCHVRRHPIPPCEPKEFTRAERQAERELLADQVPELIPYLIEVRPPSRRYNCHGYAYAHAHGWFEKPEFFIKDDFSEIPFNKARRGDVLVY